jgi:PPOX class probable F420-dependent enzyme
VELGEALERLRAARVATLGTVRPDGLPHAVPFVFVLVARDGRRTLYWAVDRKPKASQRLQRLRNLEANPNAEVLVHGYDDVDWGRLWWVRAAGVARTVSDAEERLRALEALGEKYPQYAAAPPEGLVVAIELADVRGWASG